MGFGGGVPRCGQVHGELVVLSGARVSLSEQGVSVILQAVSGLVELRVWRVSPTVGKLLMIIPSTVYGSRLRKSLSESLVTYRICQLLKVL